jgi:hypothetical protein
VSRELSDDLKCDFNERWRGNPVRRYRAFDYEVVVALRYPLLSVSTTYFTASFPPSKKGLYDDEFASTLTTWGLGGLKR